MQNLKSFFLKHQITFCFLWLSLFVVLIRLPQITGVNFIPDSDECVIGMMGNHLLKGENFPLFFYGQSYGFSSLEAILVAGGIAVFGLNALAIKLPMLLLYACSLVFLFLFAQKKTSTWFAFFVVLLFATQPSWLTWAMKARGGYLTALLLSFVLLFRWENHQTKNLAVFANGALFGLLFHAHLFWFAGWLPAALFYQRTLSKQKIIFSSLGTIFTLGIFWLIGKMQPEFWTLPESVWHALPNWDFFFSNFKTFLSGHFYYSQTIGLSYGAIIATDIWIAIHLLALLLLGILLFYKKTNAEIWLWLLISLLLLLIPVVNYNEKIHFRYWLPFSTSFIVFLFQVIRNFSWPKTAVKLAFVALLITCFWAFRAGKDIAKLDIFEPYFAHQNISRENEIKSLISFLQEQNTTRVFCCDSRLMWLLNFYSDGKIMTRYFYPTDRYLPDVIKVNDSFIRNKKGTVLGFLQNLPPEKILRETGPPVSINNRFFMLKNVDEKGMELLGFALK